MRAQSMRDKIKKNTALIIALALIITAVTYATGQIANAGSKKTVWLMCKETDGDLGVRYTAKFDKKGRMIKCRYPEGHSRKYYYDKKGRIKKEIYNGEGITGRYVTMHKFSKNGRVEKIGDKIGKKIRWDYRIKYNKKGYAIEKGFYSSRNKINAKCKFKYQKNKLLSVAHYSKGVLKRKDWVKYGKYGIAEKIVNDYYNKKGKRTYRDVLQELRYEKKGHLLYEYGVGDEEKRWYTVYDMRHKEDALGLDPGVNPYLLLKDVSPEDGIDYVETHKYRFYKKGKSKGPIKEDRWYNNGEFRLLTKYKYQKRKMSRAERLRQFYAINEIDEDVLYRDSDTYDYIY